MNGLKLIFFILITSAFLLLIVIGCDSTKPNNPIDGLNEPPEIPFYPTPSNGSTFQSIETEIYWRCLDPDGDVLTYDVFFGTDEIPPLIIEKQADTLYLLGTLSGFTTYYWKINAFDNSGDSAAGPVWNFTTGPGVNLPPNQPENPSPADGAVDQPQSLNLAWTATDPNEDDTLFYYVYFDTAANPQSVSERLSEAAYDPGALDPETQYFWKVVVYDNYGDSTVGPIWEFTTGAAAEGVFAALAVARMITFVEDQLFRFDEIVARFDSAYAPCDPISPLEADGITCNEFSLNWDTALNLHKYYDPMMQPFIELSGEYIFNVEGTPQLPSFVDTIDFPDYEPYITDPANDDTLSLAGFAVAWSSSGGGTVRFIIMSGDDSTGVSVETDNDGGYTFSSADLEPLGGQAGDYGIIMINQNSESITADGYDSRSFIWARTINVTMVRLE